MCGGTDSAATIKGTTTTAQDNTQRERNAQKWRDEWQRYGVSDPDPTKPSPDGTPPPQTGFKPGPKDTAYESAKHDRETQGFDIKPPPDAPDMADELLRKRRAAEATNLMLGRGRKDTMRPSTFGNMQIGKSKLYGGGGS